MGAPEEPPSNTAMQDVYELMDAARESTTPDSSACSHGPLSLPRVAATMLEEAVAKIPVISEALAVQHGTSQKTLGLHIHAMAEACVREQEAAMIEVLTLACSSSSLKPVCFLQRQSYDETPACLKVHYKGSARAEGELEVSKVYVVESEWSALFARCDEVPGEGQPKAEYLLLRGFLSPAVRCSNLGTAVAILGVLSSCTSFPKLARQRFPQTIRVVETDSGPANLKAETLLKAAANSVPELSGSKLSPLNILHVLCNAHRLHTTVQRVWALNQPIISGLTRLCLVLGGAGAGRKLQHAIAKLVDERLVVVQGRLLSDDALAFRAQFRDLFVPPVSQPRRRAMFEAVWECILTGDIRQSGIIEHICTGPGCCIDKPHAARKMKDGLCCLFRSIRTGIFAKNDWAHWHHCWRIVGVGGAVHALLPDMMRLAFAPDKTDAELADDDLTRLSAWMSDLPANVEVDQAAPGSSSGGAANNDADAFQNALTELVGTEIQSIGDTRGMTRVQKAWELQGALSFLADFSGWWTDFVLMRVVLQPHIQLQAALLNSTSSTSHLASLFPHGVPTSEREPDFFIAQLQRGVLTCDCLKDAAAKMCSPDLWQSMNLPETDVMRTNLLRFTAAASGFMWDRVKFQVEKFPFRLFSLLHQQTVENAQLILSRPACTRDEFTSTFLKQYPSANDLLGSECHQVLAMVAACIHSCTFTTERLHSKNIRRTRQRVSTQRADLTFMGLNHAGYAGPPWLRASRLHVTAKKNKKKRGRPVKKDDLEKLKTRKRRRMGEAASDSVQTGENFLQTAGGGGAWRSFLHSKMKGRWSAAQMAAWKAEYNAITGDEKAFHKQLGAQGASPGP